MHVWTRQITKGGVAKRKEVAISHRNCMYSPSRLLLGLLFILHHCHRHHAWFDSSDRRDNTHRRPPKKGHNRRRTKEPAPEERVAVCAVLVQAQQSVPRIPIRVVPVGADVVVLVNILFLLALYVIVLARVVLVVVVGAFVLVAIVLAARVPFGGNVVAVGRRSRLPQRATLIRVAYFANGFLVEHFRRDEEIER